MRRLRIRPTSLPWRRPRYELALLALVAVAALLPVQHQSPQDESRLCLTRALLEGHLTIYPCIGASPDVAQYGSGKYSDKAPGFAVLAIPAVLAVRLPPAPSWHYPEDTGGWVYPRDAGVWAVRILTSGLAFVLLAFLVGRVSEGIAPGWGGPALVTFALGTLVSPLAPSCFSHVMAGAFGFGAFVLAWRRSDLLAGLLAGMGILVEYQAGLIAVVVGLYVLLRGLASFGRYVAGAVPALVLLAAYDWAAFGSPFHLSYRYIANDYSAEQKSGFFGIGIPHAHSVREIFIGDHGLLFDAPIVVLAAVGLWLLWRTHRAEALVAAAVSVLFLLLNAGYFLPYGGGSPGPRFLVPALPFLALGLAPAFARWRVLTSVAAAISIAATTAVSLTWAQIWEGYVLVWSDIPRFFSGTGRHAVQGQIVPTALRWIGIGRIGGGLIVVACAAAAFALALLGQRRAASTSLRS
jgi:hypothetical protein